jgi:hypothetical protein
MAIYDLWLSRNNGTTVSTYVGHEGRLFFDPAERVLRISDGSTAGGEVFNGIVTVANTEPTANFPGQIWLNPQTYDLSIYYNGDFVPTINLATETNIGGVKLGPGVITNGEGQLIIDSTGLDFSFGDLTSTIGTYTDSTSYAVLQTINLNEDLILASNGTGGIHVVGEFRVHATNGSLTETLENIPAFEIKSDGQVKMLVPVIDSNEGAVSIVGSSTGAFIPPINSGVMLHITGQYDTPAIPSRLYNDSQNTFAAFVARRFNGTVASPTAVLADEEIMRISGTSHNGTTIPGTGQARIIYKALGNQTLTNQGGYIELWATPLNSTTIAKIATINNADGITATKFVGPLTGDVTGNVSGTAATVTTAAQPAITSVGTLTNLAIATGGSITTPRIVINDGGIRTISGGTTCTIDFATDSIILWTAPTGTAVITLSNYTAGASVKLIIAMTTSRDVTYGIASAANSSNGADNFNGAGVGSTSIANRAMHLDYTCISALAAGCYLAVTVN